MICGIDPGFSGAICVMNNHVPIKIHDMPILKAGKRNEVDGVALREILDNIPCLEHAYIEKAQSMPKQGVSSVFRYGCSYGIVIGICVGLKISYTLVHPRTWKAAMMRDMPKEKGASVLRCQQLFPDFATENLKLKKHHGRADSLLIGFWGVKHG